MIARLLGLAIDARAATRTTDPIELAYASRWIAGPTPACKTPAFTTARAE